MRYFLVYYQKHNDVTAGVKILRANEQAYPDAQKWVEECFSDPEVMRIYELRQCYAIGKFRGQ